MERIRNLLLVASFLPLLFAGSLTAQSSGRAVYSVYNVFAPDGYEAVLDFSPQHSLYRGAGYTGETRTKVKKDAVKREADKLHIRVSIAAKPDDVCVLMDAEKNEIESYEWLFRGNFLYEYRTYEPLREIDWELVDSTKQFGRFTAQGAHCAFRGREYMVWYVPEIPVSFGPWKFNGLPGLIVEASEQNGGAFRFILKEIDVKEGHEVPEAKFPKGAKRIPIADYAYFHDNRAADEQDLAAARAPRGAKVSVRSNADGGDETDVERNFKDLKAKSSEDE